jgi:pilus assembly protein CpaF
MLLWRRLFPPIGAAPLFLSDVVAEPKPARHIFDADSVTSARFVPPAPGPGSDAAAPPARRSELPDLGILRPLLLDERVTDVFLNGDGRVWVDRGAGIVAVDRPLVTPDRARELAVRLIALGGRHIDEASPCVDVRLGAGIRVHAVLAPVSTGGALISIRVPRRDPFSLDDLERSGFFCAVPVGSVRQLVESRANLLLTGAGGSGKTSFLAAVLASAPASERIVVLEDVAELRIAHPHVICLEARQPNLEGAGGIGLDRLVREALRMRPDRLVVGECRGAELRELLTALNTGHDGGAGTMHANSLDDVPARLEALGALAGLSSEAVARQAVSAFDAVLHVVRSDAARRLEALGRLVLDRRGALTVERQQ